jgi:hypothetical protein
MFVQNTKDGFGEVRTYEVPRYAGGGAFVVEVTHTTRYVFRDPAARTVARDLLRNRSALTVVDRTTVDSTSMRLAGEGAL